MVLDEHYSPWSLKRASTLISTTEATIPAPYRRKFVPVSWGANTKRFHADVVPVSTPLLPAFAGHTVGYVGSFKRWHGLTDLLEVSRRLSDLPLRFLLVGDGPERPALEAAVKTSGLQHRFVFSGAVDYAEVPGWIAAMDLCVAPFHPSQHSASKGDFLLDPLKVFEYLAMRKPTVTVNSANIQRLFKDGEHLRLVAAGNAQALSDSLKELVNDPAAAQAMAARGQAVVLQRHTWGAHATHLHALFSRMMGSAPSERDHGIAES
jgi:glycosyltransferase involved in cell wall biosynthesis